MDFLLMFLSFSSYIFIRFLVESGWTFGGVFALCFYFFLRRFSDLRHTIYLYIILLFTSPKEQAWLQRKFSLSSKIYRSRGDGNCEDKDVANLLNKTIHIAWPCMKSYLEEKIRRQVEAKSAELIKNKIKSLLQSLVDFRTEEINLGTKPPLIKNIILSPSRNENILVYNIEFRYTGNCRLKFSTQLKNIDVHNFEVGGHLRVEAGPLCPLPPFVQEVKMYMTEEPHFNFNVSGLPKKVEQIVKILSMEKISRSIVMPNRFHKILKQDIMHHYLPAGIILFHIVEARDLENKEMLRQSDPFCVTRLGYQKHTTKTVNNNTNPFWTTKSQMICDCDPTSGDFDLSFTIYDENLFFDDFLYRSKLSVRRILEEKFVDEWLENENENESENKRSEGGTLRVQALWLSLISDLSELHNQLKLGKNKESASSASSDIQENAEPWNHCSSNVLKETIASNSRKNVSKINAKQSNEKDEFITSVLLIWIETAEKLYPLWEHFQIELKFYGGIERTSFVPRGRDGKWYFRQRFLVPVKVRFQDEIIFKLISKSKEKCDGELILNISWLLEDLNNNFTTLKDFKFTDKNKSKINASLKMNFGFQGIESVSCAHLNSFREAEEEAINATFRQPCIQNSLHSASSYENFAANKEGKIHSESGRSVFTFTEIGWDICPPFMMSNSFDRGHKEVIRGTLVSAEEKGSEESVTYSFNMNGSRYNKEKSSGTIESGTLAANENSSRKRRVSIQKQKLRSWIKGRKEE